jgi:hypothetical protein
MMPSMNCRCMNTNTATTGTVASVEDQDRHDRQRGVSIGVTIHTKDGQLTGAVATCGFEELRRYSQDVWAGQEDEEGRRGEWEDEDQVGIDPTQRLGELVERLRERPGTAA